MGDGECTMKQGGKSVTKGQGVRKKTKITQNDVTNTQSKDSTVAIDKQIFRCNGVFSKWSKTFIEFSEFRAYEKSLKHELGSE